MQERKRKESEQQEDRFITLFLLLLPRSLDADNFPFSCFWVHVYSDKLYNFQYFTVENSQKEETIFVVVENIIK